MSPVKMERPHDTWFGFHLRRRLRGLGRAGFALALGVGALVVTPAVAEATATWSSPVATSSPGGLKSVSCPTTSFCMAVDVHGNALTYNNGSWSSTSIDPNGPALQSVSCPTTGFCAAADNYWNALTYNGSWSSPTAITNGANLPSVSCPTSTFCMAVDDTGHALTYNSGSWSQPLLIDTYHNGILDSVSCPTTSFCMAIDLDGNALTFSSGSWSQPLLIDPAGTSTGNLYSVSCPTTSFCVAVDQSGNALTYNNGSWSSPIAIDATNQIITSVSCPTTSFCMAVDAYGNALTFNGFGWSTTSIDSSGLYSVSCPTSSYCVAVDSSGKALTYSAPTVPGKPTSVAGTSGANGQSVVTWVAPSSDGGSAITGYTVESSGTSGGTYTTTNCANVNALTCTVTGLTNGTPYYFKVEATSSAGTGPLSSPSIATTPAATAPLAPTSVAGTSGANGESVVTWNPPSSDGGSPITGYTVESSSSSGGTFATASMCSNVNTLTCTVTGLTNGVGYYFKVKAINLVGTGPLSSASTVATTGYAGAVLGDHPSVYYRFDETSGTTAIDSTGDTAGATYGTSGVTPGQPGAILSDATNFAVVGNSSGPMASYVDTTNVLPHGSSARSVQVWMKTTTITPNNQVLVFYGDLTNTGTAFFMGVKPSATGGSTVTIVGNYNGDLVFNVPQSLADGSWHELVVTYDGVRTDTLYVDGQSEGSQSLSSAYVTPLGTTLDVGWQNQFNGVANFVGSLDELAIFPSALSAAQVTATYNAASVGQGANVITPGAPPSSPVVGGATYTPTATATSGDTVAITLDGTPAGCTLSGGVVSFTAVGTCLIDFNDVGNANYAAATQVQQSLSVVAASSGGGGGSTTGPPNAPPPSSASTDGTVSYGIPVSKSVSTGAATSILQTSNGATVTVTVPVGALPSGTTVSMYPVTDTVALTAQVPAGQSYVVAFAVAWEAPGGTSPSATTPVTMTITDPSIVAGDTIYELTSTGLVALGTASANGTVTVTFSSDPTFTVTHHVTLLAQAPITLNSTKGTVGKALTLTSSGGSGASAVTYAVTSAGSANCSITGGVLNATRAGTCTVTATKAADATYQSVSSASTTMTFTARVAPVRLHAAWVHGYAVTGRTVVITIGGRGFWGRPTIASHGGTTARVQKDNGRILKVKVSVEAGSHDGTFTFTITLANGHSCRVRYVQRG